MFDIIESKMFSVRRLLIGKKNTSKMFKGIKEVILKC
jgi:hypothetical protein